MPLEPASDFFAMQLTGDLGGITFVQRAGNRRTSYAKTYPKRTPSGAQIIFRERFKDAMRNYHALSDEQRQTLRAIVDRFNMTMLGMNLYVSCFLTGHLDWIQQWASELGLEW